MNAEIAALRARLAETAETCPVDEELEAAYELIEALTAALRGRTE